MVIVDYYIINHWWLSYWRLLMVILLELIKWLFYWNLLIFILLMASGNYSIDDYSIKDIVGYSTLYYHKLLVIILSYVILNYFSYVIIGCSRLFYFRSLYYILYYFKLSCMFKIK